MKTIEQLREERGNLNAQTLHDDKSGDPDADGAYTLWQKQFAALEQLEVIVRRGVS